MDDYIKKWAKRLFKVHPNPNKIKSGDGKKLHSQLIEELKGVGVTDLVNQAFRLLEFDATVQKEIILKGVNKNSAFGVTVATNLDDPTKLDNESELTKFNVFGTAKGHIQDIFFQMKQTKIKKGFRRNGKVEIEDTASLSSAEATALYEATASIALGASSTDVGKLEGYLKQKYILDDGNYDGELIDHFFADIKTISVSGIDYTEWNSTMANWYLETLMGIIKGALLFRKEYATFFNAGVSEILWKDIDKTFKNKWFTKIGSGRVGHLSLIHI